MNPTLIAAVCILSEVFGLSLVRGEVCVTHLARVSRPSFYIIGCEVRSSDEIKRRTWFGLEIGRTGMANLTDIRLQCVTEDGADSIFCTTQLALNTPQPQRVQRLLLCQRCNTMHSHLSTWYHPLATHTLCPLPFGICFGMVNHWPSACTKLQLMMVKSMETCGRRISPTR